MIDRHRRWVRRLARAPVALYRWHLDRVLGHRFLLLEHRGRRSGRRYQTVLEVVKWEPGGEIVVMSGWGPVADWYRNVTAGCDVHVTVAGDRFPAAHRVLPADEASRVLADYEYRNRFVRPIVNWTLGRLSGRPFDGSEQSRRQLVQQLPMVGFRPASS